MVDELQALIDALGRELQRSVALDDDRMQLRVYSRHVGPVDEPRLSSVLQRAADPRVIEYVDSFGIRRARTAMRIPANEELHMLARVCVPAWHRNERLGFLWLLDPEEALPDAAVDRAEQVAREVAAVMSQERIIGVRERDRERDLMSELLSPDESLRAGAAAALVADGAILPRPEVRAIVLRSASAPEQRVIPATHLDIALSHARQMLPLHSSAHLALSDHGVLVVAAPTPPAALNDVCRRLADELRPLDGGAATDVVVGVGAAHDGLHNAHRSYREALRASQVAELVPALGPVAWWSDLGVYRVLVQLPPEELTAASLDRRLTTLFSADADGVLTRTLETYLECGGDTRLTIERLVLHRTSLYYRLEKIEKITGFRLAEGEDRLVAHLGLKIARLAGAHPMSGRTPPRPGDVRDDARP